MQVLYIQTNIHAFDFDMCRYIWTVIKHGDVMDSTSVLPVWNNLFLFHWVRYVAYDRNQWWTKFCHSIFSRSVPCITKWQVVFYSRSLLTRSHFVAWNRPMRLQDHQKCLIFHNWNYNVEWPSVTRRSWMKTVLCGLTLCVKYCYHLSNESIMLLETCNTLCSSWTKYRNNACSTDKIFLQDFLKILKRTLQIKSIIVCFTHFFSLYFKKPFL